MNKIRIYNIKFLSTGALDTSLKIPLNFFHCLNISPHTQLELQLVIKFSPRLLYSWETTPSTIRIDACMSPRVGLAVLEKRKICCPCHSTFPPKCALHLKESENRCMVQSKTKWFKQTFGEAATF